MEWDKFTRSLALSKLKLSFRLTLLMTKHYRHAFGHWVMHEFDILKVDWLQ
jgi:hypothetical protein